ncbi:MAG: HD domain-containing protein [Xanthomonadales bacterium]|jgi:uncharacterized protein|nr:HD domain-containing protein [Xanthomonadales bacterium]
MNPERLQAQCFEFIARTAPADAAHDLSHIKRVVKTALYLTDIEQANIDVTLPAACLHDCVSVSKDSPLRSQASRLAADAAVEFLARMDYPGTLLPDIAHAIEAHSYSAAIPCKTLEARVVQDADRMDALGMIGIARCFVVGGKFNLPLFNPEDPFCENREPDETSWVIDHFYTKLFKLPDTMQTEAGRHEARRRARLMRQFLENLRQEIL